MAKSFRLPLKLLCAVGIIAYIVIAKHIGFCISWRDVAIAVCISSAAGLLANVTVLHQLPSSTVILAVSILGYARSGLIAKKDLKEVSITILPRTVTEHAYSRFRWLYRLLYGE